MRLPGFLARRRAAAGPGRPGDGDTSARGADASAGKADEDAGYRQRLEEFKADLSALSPRQVSLVLQAWRSLSKPRRDAAWQEAREVTRTGGVPLAKPSAEAVTFVQRWAGRRPDGMSKEAWADQKPIRGQAVPALIGAGVAFVLGDRLDAQSSAVLLTAWRAAARYGDRGSGRDSATGRGR